MFVCCIGGGGQFFIHCNAVLTLYVAEAIEAMDLRERKVIHLLKTVLGSGGRFSHRCRISSS